MNTIWRKEVSVYLHSLSGYVFLSVFLFVFGIYFSFNNLQSASRDISVSLQNLPVFLLFLTPVLTMNTLAGERRGRTLPLLFSSPVDTADIVLGKYFAVLTVLLLGMIPLVFYTCLLTFFGGSFTAREVLSLTGFFLLCASFFAIGVFASSLTDHPIVAAVLTYVLLFFFIYAESMATVTNIAPLKKLLYFLSFSGRFRYCLMGILDLSDMVYFVSVIAVFLFFAVRVMHLNSISFEKNPRAVSMEAAVFILSAACFALFNLIAIQTTVRFSLVTDLTYQSLFSLSDASRDLLNELDSPVRITCLNTREESDPNVVQLLDRYAAASPFLAIEWVSLVQHPELAAEYEAKGTPVTANGLILTSGRRERILAPADLYELASSDGTTVSVQAFAAEQKLTGAIAYVTGSDHGICIVQGHDEEISDRFSTLLADNALRISYSTLTVQDIPEETDLLLLAAPRRDLTQEELKKADDFLQQGGTLLVFLPPYSVLPNLSAFLEEWGIIPNWALVREPDLHYQRDTNLLPSYNAHRINDYFSDNSVFLVFPQTQAFRTEDVPGRTVSPVLLSSADAVTENEPGSAPFCLAVTSEAVKAAGGGKIFASGSSALWDDALLSTDTFANREFLVQVLTWAMPDSGIVSIASKSLVSRPLAITDQAALLWTIVTAALVPLTLWVIGLVIHIRRKKRI